MNVPEHSKKQSTLVLEKMMEPFTVSDKGTFHTNEKRDCTFLAATINRDRVKNKINK